MVPVQNFVTVGNLHFLFDPPGGHTSDRGVCEVLFGEAFQFIVSVQLLILEHVAEHGRGCFGSFQTPGAVIVGCFDPHQFWKSIEESNVTGCQGATRHQVIEGPTDVNHHFAG